MAGPLEGYATSGHVINAASVYPPAHVSGANGHGVDRSTHVSFANGHGANVARSNVLQPANVSGANGHEANVPRSNALQPASYSVLRVVPVQELSLLLLMSRFFCSIDGFD